MNTNGAPPSPAPSPETWSSSTAPTNANPNAPNAAGTGNNNATLSSGATSSPSGRSGQFSGSQRSPNITGRHQFNSSGASSYRPRPSRTTHYYGPGSAAAASSVASPVPLMAAGSGFGPGMLMSPPPPGYGPGPYQRIHAPLDRRTGHVKFFNSTKGFGFIIPDVPLDDTQSELEVFVHHTAITSPNRSFRSLAEGEPVEFDLVQGPKGYYSQNVTGPQGAPVRGDPKVLTIPRKPLPNFYHPRQGYPHEFATNTDASGVAILPSGEHSPSPTGPGEANDPSSVSGMMSHSIQPGMVPPHMASLPPGAVMYFIPVPPMMPGQPGDASQDAGGGGPTSPIPTGSTGQPQQQFMYQPYGYHPFHMQQQGPADGSGAIGPQSPTSPAPSVGSATSNATAGMPPQPYMVPMPSGYPMPYAYMSPPPHPMSPTHHPTSPSGPGASPMADASFSASTASMPSSLPPGFIPTHSSTPTLGMYGGGAAPPHHLSMPITPVAHVSSAPDVQGMEAHMANLSFGGGSGTGMPRTDSGHDFQSPLAKQVGGSTSVRRASLSTPGGTATATGVEAAQEAAVTLQDDYPGEQ